MDNTQLVQLILAAATAPLWTRLLGEIVRNVFAASAAPGAAPDALAVMASRPRGPSRVPFSLAAGGGDATWATRRIVNVAWDTGRVGTRRRAAEAWSRPRAGSRAGPRAAWRGAAGNAGRARRRSGSPGGC